MKRIPSSLQMGPHTVQVRIVSAEEMREECKRTNTALSDKAPAPLGLTVYEEYTILIQKCRKGISKHLQMHAWWHEYFHMLFYCIGRERLADDELLVDNCGAMQLQAINSAEF